MNKIIKKHLAIAVVMAISAWSTHSVADSKITDGPANLGSTTATRTPDGVLEVVGGSTTKPTLVVRGVDCPGDSATVSSCTPSMLVTRAGLVGVGTTNPQAALDVTSTSAGFLPPRMTSTQRNALVSPAKGTVIFNNTNNALEINSGTPSSPSWVGASSNVVVGDIKTGLQTTDHNGWVKLDGRPISTLSPTQIANATALGIGTNLPDATNAFLTQNGAAPGTVSGSNTRTIAQNQLPNVTLTGSTDGATANSILHPATGLVTNGQFGLIQKSNGGNNTPTAVDSSPGEANVLNNFQNHYHTFTTSSINGNVIQQALDITPRSLSVNTFVFLGN